MEIARNETFTSLGKYSNFNYRNLSKGETVLLAKAIADAIKLPSEGTEDVSTYLLANHKLKIINLLDDISTQLFVEDKDVTYNLIKDFFNWRFRIAYNPSNLMFSSGADSIIDDLSCLNKFVDTSAMCAISDVHENATYIYKLFRDISNQKLR